MADFYTGKKLTDILESYNRSVAAMQGSVKQLGDQGGRAVQLWSQAAGLVDEDELAAANTQKASDSIALWNAVKSDLAKAMDALTAGTGMTRQQILDDLAAIPATDFGV